MGNGKVAGAGGANWRAAVASTLVTATTGKAILSGGRPITAFYFAASGGRTQASQNVWVSALPYAASVDDHWSMDPSVPWSRWTPRVRSQALVAAAFGLPNVVRVDVSKKLPSGAVSTATAWSSSGHELDDPRRDAALEAVAAEHLGQPHHRRLTPGSGRVQHRVAALRRRERVRRGGRVGEQHHRAAQHQRQRDEGERGLRVDPGGRHEQPPAGRQAQTVGERGGRVERLRLRP